MFVQSRTVVYWMPLVCHVSSAPTPTGRATTKVSERSTVTMIPTADRRRRRG